MPDLRETVLGQVDAAAAHERAGAEYVLGLIEANEPAFREAFVTEDTPEVDVPDRIYEGVTSTLDFLATQYTRPVGVMIYHRPPDDEGNDTSVVRLGWARFDRAFPGDDARGRKTIPYLLHLTENGIEVINGLRAAKGIGTLQEQRARNNATWERVIQAGDEEDAAGVEA